MKTTFKIEGNLTIENHIRSGQLDNANQFRLISLA